MTTIRTIINDALNDLEVKSAEVDLTTEELNTGMRYINRLMTTFAVSGINVGFTKAVSVDDEFTAPDWFEEVIITHLAIRLAPGFGIQVSPAIVMAAKEAIKQVQRRVVHLHPVEFPNVLPIGSGNYQGDNTRFFHDDNTNDLTSASGDILDDDESVTLSTD